MPTKKLRRPLDRHDFNLLTKLKTSGPQFIENDMRACELVQFRFVKRTFEIFKQTRLYADYRWRYDITQLGRRELEAFEYEHGVP